MDMLQLFGSVKIQDNVVDGDGKLARVDEA
jgi:hypothetical protein